MNDFEIRVIKNNKGEISIKAFDYKTKKKVEYSHDEIKEALNKVGSLVWFARFTLEKLEDIFRGTEKQKTNSPF